MVGQLGNDAGFTEFAQRLTGRVVRLDVSILDNEFSGGNESDAAVFVIFDECDRLPKGQKPDQTHCSGTAFNIPHALGAPGLLTHEANGWHLRGKFRVEDGGGPVQGLMTIVLRPVE